MNAIVDLVASLVVEGGKMISQAISASKEEAEQIEQRLNDALIALRGERAKAESDHNKITEETQAIIDKAKGP